MDNETKIAFLDYSEQGYPWHIDIFRRPENVSWTNIGYGYEAVISHFCNVVDVMSREFGFKFTTGQIIRLAECTPGITVFRPSPKPEDSSDVEVHMRPIWSREYIENMIGWKKTE